LGLALACAKPRRRRRLRTSCWCAACCAPVCEWPWYHATLPFWRDLSCKLVQLVAAPAAGAGVPTRTACGGTQKLLTLHASAQARSSRESLLPPTAPPALRCPSCGATVATGVGPRALSAASFVTSSVAASQPATLLASQPDLTGSPLFVCDALSGDGFPQHGKLSQSSLCDASGEAACEPYGFAGSPCAPHALPSAFGAADSSETGCDAAPHHGAAIVPCRFADEGPGVRLQGLLRAAEHRQAHHSQRAVQMHMAMGRGVRSSAPGGFATEAPDENNEIAQPPAELAW
jgi:hypothetical protein